MTERAMVRVVIRRHASVHGKTCDMICSPPHTLSNFLTTPLMYPVLQHLNPL